MSNSNYCFLTCIQSSQEADKVVLYSHLFQNFPQLIVIHTVKGFGIVNKAEIDVFFWNYLAFLMTQWILSIWSLVPLPFLKPAWTSGSSPFTYCWSRLGEFWALLYLCVRQVQLCGSLNILWHCVSLGLEWNGPFPVLWPLLSFPNLLAYWVQHFHSIIFQDLHSSTGIPSPPLALFVVMLSKAHLTSHSMMSGSRWVITPSWLSSPWGSFLYSSVYSCHLLLISSAC